MRNQEEFPYIDDTLSTVQEYMFLALFFVMLIVNIDLLWQIRKKEKSLIENSLKREKCVLITVLFLFELSYLLRFIFNEQGTDLLEKKEYFKFLLWQDVSYTFEAVSFLALIVFHYKNFRP